MTTSSKKHPPKTVLWKNGEPVSNMVILVKGKPLYFKGG